MNEVLFVNYGLTTVFIYLLEAIPFATYSPKIKFGVVSEIA